ncbi:MAG TPA: DUF4150 domain-containing protein [Polyangiaceae bacterium]|nr:DUF4150 domain-containing protein [Polyangiaceae bacterium]
MADTTGNQNRVIATNGTSHVAMTMGPTDVCKLPNNVPVPFPNFISAKGNLQKGTTNTKIANQPVWIQRSNLGPTSNPPHAGVNKGVASGTYRGIAKATGFSKDVQMEGQFVVRTGDPTTQNKANTTGSVAGSNMMPQVEAQDAYKKLLCTITKLEGKCGHGRELGPPPGAAKNTESNYLEILLGDTVEFTSTRENLITRVVDPGCEKGIHTHWEAKTTGQSWKEQAKGAVLGPPEVEKKDSLKVYKLGGKLTDEDGSVTVGKTKSEESDVKDYTRRNRMKSPKPEDDGFLGTPSENVTAKNSSGNWAHDGAVTNKGDKAEQERRDKANFKRKITGLIKDAALFWDAAAHPRVITVESSACSGKKAATIKCFPKDKLEVSLFDEKVTAAVEKVQSFLKLVERSTSFFGWPAKIEFLKDPKLNFGIEYKELTADKPEKSLPYNIGKVGPYWKVQCRRAWSLSFGFSPLIGGFAKGTAPIAAALPAVGPAVATVMKWIGAKGDFFMKLEIQFAPKGTITWTEYDVVTVDVSAEFTITFSAGIEIYVKVAEATVYGYLEGKVTFDNWGPRPGYLLACDMKGEIQLGVKGAATASFWGVKYSKDFDYKPECLKCGNKDPIMIPIRSKPASGGAASP